MENITLEIAVNCYCYQRRLDWMLSSVLQQEGDLPNIIFNVTYIPNNGIPTTEEICKFFKEKGLNVKETVMKDRREISNRGFCRNKQLSETIADWILFADCDMVFDKMFFDDLKKQLIGPLKDVDKCITADRHSLDINFSDKYLKENLLKYPCVVENVSDLVSKWPIRGIGGRGIGPGNFQLANVKCIMQKIGAYSKRCRDIWRRTKTDRHFRCNMGGVYPINVKKQYHINHLRSDVEEQR